MTVDQTGDHLAGVLVHEIPIQNSHWGTFFGFGMTSAHHELEHSQHEIPTFSNVGQPDNHHDYWAHSFILQTGLAYAIDSHWSTGFTLSPGFDFTEDHMNVGATLDLVFGF